MRKLGALIIACAAVSSALAATKTVTLDVKGWTCGSCATATRIVLKKLGGVESVKTDHEKMEATVTYDDSKVTTEKLVRAVENVGYSATVRSVTDGHETTVPSGGLQGAMRTDTSKEDLVPEDVSFFEVPLECGAAAELGCGSESKPILREVEKDSRVGSAKINHPGTLLAVAWKDPSQAPLGVRFVVSVLEEKGLEAASIRGSARDKALREYKSGQWYGSKEVDRLSEREAQVIASRLVTRARLGLNPEVEKALTDDLTAIFAKHLTSDSPSDRAMVEEELVKAAGKHLTASQMEALKKAGEQGVRALPGEAK